MVAYVEGIYVHRAVFVYQKKVRLLPPAAHENARQMPPRVRDNGLMKMTVWVPREI